MEVTCLPAPRQKERFYIEKLLRQLTILDLAYQKRSHAQLNEKFLFFSVTEQLIGFLDRIIMGNKIPHYI